MRSPVPFHAFLAKFEDVKHVRACYISGTTAPVAAAFSTAGLHCKLCLLMFTDRPHLSTTTLGPTHTPVQWHHTSPSRG